MKKIRLRDIWPDIKRYVLIGIICIAFYELLENLPVLQGVWKKVSAVCSPIIGGLFFAFIVNIPLRFFEEKPFKKLRLKRKKTARVLSLVLSYLIVLGIVALVIGLVVPKLFVSITQLIDNAEEYYDIASTWVTEQWQKLNLKDEVSQEIFDIINSLLVKVKDFVIETVPKLLSFTVSAVNVIYTVVMSLIISIYALVRKEKLLNQAKRLIRAAASDSTADYLLDACKLANVTFRRYFLGQFTSCGIIGILCYICMRIFSMPYPELISAFICVAALVPIIGPWASTIPSAFIILMASTDNPMLAVWFVVMIIVIQQIESNLIYPRVMDDAVGISGIWVLCAIIIGGGLFGFMGILLAVPTTAVIYRLIANWVNKRNAEKEAERQLSEAD